MIKFFGIFMIAGVCIYVGFALSQRLKVRSEFISCFISALYTLETEISFSMSTLKDIFSRLGGENKLCGFFEECAEQMDESGLKAAWERATNTLCETASLKEKDITVIRALGSELGMSDVMGQKKAIGRVCELLKVNEAEARDEYIKLSGVYKKCGALTAAFVVLILI